MSKILVRFDDICPTMNWTQWYKAKNLLDSISAKALIGVIPNCKDPDLLIDEPFEGFWEYIRLLEKEGFKIAMHGYEHVFDIQSSGIVTPQKHSEFAGHPYEVQYDKIRKGKEILLTHGIETDIFFAPAHSYDDNTLKALCANGFKYISDGYSSKPYTRHGIICLPCHSGGIPKLKNKNGFVTAVVHTHEWSLPKKSNDWIKFQEMCKNHSSEIVYYKEYATQSNGNSIIQANIELLYSFYRIKIIPILVKLKYLLKRYLAN